MSAWTNSTTSTIAKKSHHLLSSLIKSNQAILSQKLSLLHILESKEQQSPSNNHNTFFTTKCPIVQASIGQHYRHSMDHIELAALVASASAATSATPTNRTGDSASTEIGRLADDPKIVTLRYDLRVRGGTLERDVAETKKRIESVITIFDELLVASSKQLLQYDNIENEHTIKKEPWTNIANEKVNASFMLTSSTSNSNDDDEMILKSTIGRELGFCAHHAIHHMAMVKIIAVQTLGVTEHELPLDFGKAPSTVRFETTDGTN